MFKRTLSSTTALITLAAASSTALAHGGHSGAGGFVSGFEHPLFGPDHLLAMVAVGLLAARARGRALWLFPLCFVGLMAAGGLIALAGIGQGTAAIEWAIALSVLVFGLMIAVLPKVSLSLGAAVVGLFAVFHGHAHIAEMSGSVGGYMPGMLLATALLHAAGVGVGLGLGRLANGWALRLSGGAVAAGFVLLVAGVL